MRFLFCLALLVAVSGAAAQESGSETGHDATVDVKFDDVQQWLERFEPPDRRNWQKPGLVLRLIGIAEGMTVADIGAGTGYFTQYLVSSVGQMGKVYAVDVEPGMLDFLVAREEMYQSYFNNLETVLADPGDPKLPDGEIELILIVNTWHHIDDRLAYIRKLERALDPDSGRVALIDWHAGELPVGPPADHKLSRESVIAEFAEAGWSRVTESVALPYQYLITFRPAK